MTNLEIASQVFILILVVIFYFSYKNFIPSYFSEKGKNLATVQDIDKITRIVEDIKTTNSKILEDVKYKNEIDKLIKSSTYNDSRKAYTDLLKTFYEIKTEWNNTIDYQNDKWLPAPTSSIDKIDKTVCEHTFFYDEECNEAISIFQNAVQDSYFDPDLEYEKFINGEVDEKKCRWGLDICYHVYKETILLTRNKIGLNKDTKSFKTLSIIGGLVILNAYSFPSIELPTKGRFMLNKYQSLSQAINNVKENEEAFADELKSLKNYLSVAENYFFWDDLCKKLNLYINSL